MCGSVCKFSHNGQVEVNGSPDEYQQDGSNSNSEHSNEDAPAVFTDVHEITMNDWSGIQRSDDGIRKIILMMEQGKINKRKLLETDNH